ncbi:MAG: carboxypeptidase-like regulatory domain-containing protein, partial [Acidobacteriota bacterium]
MLLAIAFAAALPTSTAAQVGQVNGTVLDADSRQLPGASVALIPTSGSTIYGTSSGPDGRYAFKGLTSDTYNVVMSTPDGRIVRKNGVHVRALFRSIVDFKL